MNKRSTRGLRYWRLAACVAFTLFGLLSVSRPGAAATPRQERAPETRRVTTLIVEATNAFRREQRLNAVALNDRLAEAARQFAGYMAKTDRFSHDADGSNPATRATQHGYDYCIVSENIAYEFSSAGFTTEDLARRLVEGWKRSPGHRANMVEPAVTETGVALARSPGTDRYYAVQMFGRSSAESIRFEIANTANASIRYRLGSRAYTLSPRQTRTHEGCRPDELRIFWPGRQQETLTRPENGDRFSVVRDGTGRYALQQQ